jgi:hypothetical protein
MTQIQIESKDGRSVAEGQLVRVYKNLNREDCFSIQDKKSKLVLGYASSVRLSNVKYIVGESSRQRVLRDKRRNVHAYCEGFIVSTGESIPEGATKGYYNPYNSELFINEETKKPLHESVIAHCQGTRVYFIQNRSD